MGRYMSFEKLLNQIFDSYFGITLLWPFFAMEERKSWFENQK